MRRVLVVLSVLVAVTGCHEAPLAPVDCGAPGLADDLRAAAEPCWNAQTGVYGTRQLLEADLIVTEDDAEYSDLDIDGCVKILTGADRVHLTNVRIFGDHQCSEPPPAGHGAEAMLYTGGDGDHEGFHDFRHVEIDASNAAGDDVLGVGQANYVCSHCKIGGGNKGAKGGGPSILVDSYIYSTRDAELHGEGFLYSGGCGNVHVIHSWIRSSNNLKGNTGAVAFINDATCPTTQAASEIRDSYMANDLARQNAGGAGIAAGAFCPKPAPFIDHMTVTGNVIAWRVGKPFAYGFDPNGPGNVWGGNVSLDVDETVATTVPAPGPDGCP